MTRYYLAELSVEGFRGINNAGDPLTIKLLPNAVNSIHAPNGVGKTSIFEAIHYAIFGEVPRLIDLQAAERPETYINNRFHPGDASVVMTFATDDGSPNVNISVRRTKAGVRTATSATGHTDPEGFLRSLREDFVLVDYRKFARFIDETALVRGRSFAALVGLSRYSSLRRALEGARQTQSLNTDFDMRALETEIRGNERQLSDYTRLALAAYTDVTSQAVADLADLADIPALCAAVTAALRDIEILKEALGTADILSADFDALEKAVEAAEGGPLRRQHATLSARVTALKSWRPIPMRGSNGPACSRLPPRATKRCSRPVRHCCASFTSLRRPSSAMITGPTRSCARFAIRRFHTGSILTLQKSSRHTASPMN